LTSDALRSWRRVLHIEMDIKSYLKNFVNEQLSEKTSPFFLKRVLNEIEEFRNNKEDLIEASLVRASFHRSYIAQLWCRARCDRYRNGDSRGWVDTGSDFYGAIVHTTRSH